MKKCLRKSKTEDVAGGAGLPILRSDLYAALLQSTHLPYIRITPRGIFDVMKNCTLSIDNALKYKSREPTYEKMENRLYALFCVLLLAACRQNNADQVQPKEAEAPLTGLKTEQKLAERRPIAVAVNNHPKASNPGCQRRMLSSRRLRRPDYAVSRDFSK